MPRIVDLSMEIFQGMPVFPGHQKTVIFPVTRYGPIGPGKVAFSVNGFMMSDHAGTHVDAFTHMDPDPEAETIDQIPLDWHYTPAVCIDVSDVEPADYITKERIQKALADAGLELPSGRSTVLFYTGHYNRTFPDPKQYNGAQPGPDRAAVEWLADQGVINIGIDAPAIDANPHREGDEWKQAHMVCRERKVLNTENLANLDQVAGQAFTYCAFPLKLRAGTGAPVRAVAIFND